MCEYKYKHHEKLHTTQEGDRFSVPEVNMLWCKMCASTAEHKQHLVKVTRVESQTASLSTLKPVLYRHGLRGHSVRTKPLLHKSNTKKTDYSLQRHKELNFWKHVLWSDETKIELFGHNAHHYIWRKKREAHKPENTVPTVKQGGTASCCGGVLLPEGLVHSPK